MSRNRYDPDVGESRQPRKDVQTTGLARGAVAHDADEVVIPGRKRTHLPSRHEAPPVKEGYAPKKSIDASQGSTDNRNVAVENAYQSGQ